MMSASPRKSPGLKKQWRWKIGAFLMINLAVLLVLPFLPDYQTGRDNLLSPGADHLLGTNEFGQDVLVGLLIATPNTVFVALATALLSISIAIIMALVAAVGAPIFSAAIMRVVDMLQIIPSILILLLLAAWFHPGLIGIVILLALTTWYDDVRILRSIFLRELTRENVHYARQKGAGWGYCLTRHIIPAIWPALVGLYIQNVRQAAMQMAGLGFIGLTDPRLISWGSMMQDASSYLYEGAWLWLLLPPAICLSLFLHFMLSLGRKLEQQSMAKDEAV